MSIAPANNEVLLCQQRGAVLKVTLNRPHQQNRLSRELLIALHAAIERANHEDGIHALVIAANGTEFCAGFEIAEFVTLEDPAARRAACLASNDLMLALATCAKATIASVQGAVHGAGLELLASCDLAIATDTAEFAAHGVNVGLWDHTAQVALSRLTSRKHAMELLLTGAAFSAADAVRMGLVNRMVRYSELAACVDELANSIAGKSTYAVTLGKSSYDHQAPMQRADAYEYVSDQYYRDLQSADVAEGIAAAAEGREPDWQGR